MPIPLAIAAAGALGALARYGVDSAISGHASPRSTFAINVAGSFLVGLAVERVSGHWLRPAVTVGFLGAFTTFSTLSLQTYRLIDAGRVALALAYAGGSLAAGLTAVTAGVALGRVL